MFDKDELLLFALEQNWQWAKMVKANEELTAAAKANSDLLIAVRKEVANHALAAKLAIEQAQDMINVTYTGGERLFEHPDGAKPLQELHLLKDHERRILMIHLDPMHKTLMVHQVKHLVIIQETIVLSVV